MSDDEKIWTGPDRGQSQAAQPDVSSPDVDVVWTGPKAGPVPSRGKAGATNETYAERVDRLLQLGFRADGTCLYGCPGVVSPVVPRLALHHMGCEFWRTEQSKDKTPF